MSKRTNALELLRRDHREVQQMLRRCAKAAEPREQRRLIQQIMQMLRLHMELEEQLFYPYVRETTGRMDLMEEAQIEHAAAKNLLQELEAAQDDPVRSMALLRVLAEYLSHHIEEEEEKIFPQLAKTGVDLEAMGLELMEQRQTLQGGRRESRAKRSSAGDGDESQTGRRASRPEPRAADMTQPREEDEEFLREYGDGLSASTQRAQWIHAPGDRADHPGQTLATRNPEVIRQWAEARKAIPATTAGGDPERPRVLRFDFPGYDKGLQHISWEAWLRTFEERKLVFLFQDQMKAGNQSNFFRLDHPEREEA